MLTRPAHLDLVSARSDPPARLDLVGAGPERPSLDAELDALFAGQSSACLVCGEPVDVEADRVVCGVCGSALEPEPRVGPDQLALV